MIDLQNQIFENIQKKTNNIGYGMEIHIDKDVFGLYTLCVGLLMGKTILMSAVTMSARFAAHVGIIKNITV